MAFMHRARSYHVAARRRRGLHWALLGAAVLSVAAAGDASAQFAYGYMRGFSAPAYDDDAPLPPRAVVGRLQDRGFTEITRPRFDGRAYVVEATNPAGRRVRLFVDAQDGGVVGRQRLDTAYFPSDRVARAAPGYGWTEDDAARHRAGRDADLPLPPADIPLPRPSLHAEIDRAPGLPARPGSSDGAPFGVNPDGRAGTRAEPRKADKGNPTTQRKTARLTPPTKPAAPRMAPESPVPQTTTFTPNAPSDPSATQVPAKAPDVAKAPEPAPVPVEPKADAPPVMPAAKLPEGAEVQTGAKPAEAPAPAEQAVAKPPRTEGTAERAETEKPAGEQPASTPPVAGQSAGETAKAAANRGWQDPPSAESKRNVRVIGGAIVVPGGEPAPAAN